MDIIKTSRVVIDFDVWEPMEKHVLAEMDRVIKYVRHELSHAGNVRVSTVTVVSEKKL